MVNKTYEVSGTIRIKDGHKSHGLKFEKRDMECDGPVDTPKFYTQILDDFTREVVEESEQTTLDQPLAEKKEKKTKKPADE